jgi:hypothetical protein
MADPAPDPAAALEGEFSRETGRKQAFQRYLQQHRVMDALNTAVQELYRQEELPADPLEFICGRLKLAGRCGTEQQ